MAKVPASIRNKNPGAMYPGPSAKKFGATTHEVLKSKDGEHKIATFAEHQLGGAAMFDLLCSKNYLGLTIEKAITKWCGGFRASSYMKVLEEKGGVTRAAKLTPELLLNADVAIPLAKSMALQEAGTEYPMTDAEWAQAHELAFPHGVAVVDVKGETMAKAKNPAAPVADNSNVPAGSKAPWLELAIADLGMKEIPGKANNPKIMECYVDCGHPEVAYEDTAWCAGFVGSKLMRSGKPLPATQTNLMARSYLKYGTALDKPVPGCIAVWPRGKPPQGHVGFVFTVDEEKGTIKTIEGNVGNEVKWGNHKISEALGYRWPPETGVVAVTKVAASSKSTWLTLTGAGYLVWGGICDGFQGAFDGIMGVVQLMPGMESEITTALSTANSFSGWLGLPFNKIALGLVVAIMGVTIFRHIRDKYEWNKS